MGKGNARSKWEAVAYRNAQRGLPASNAREWVSLDLFFSRPVAVPSFLFRDAHSFTCLFYPLLSPLGCRLAFNLGLDGGKKGTTSNGFSRVLVGFPASFCRLELMQVGREVRMGTESDEVRETKVGSVDFDIKLNGINRSKPQLTSRLPASRDACMKYEVRSTAWYGAVSGKLLLKYFVRSMSWE